MIRESYESDTSFNNIDTTASVIIFTFLFHYIFIASHQKGPDIRTPPFFGSTLQFFGNTVPPPVYVAHHQYRKICCFLFVLILQQKFRTSAFEEPRPIPLPDCGRIL